MLNRSMSEDLNNEYYNKNNAKNARNDGPNHKTTQP